jgi:hypothetical protein
MVKCEICGGKFKVITAFHLKTHSYTVEGYTRDFPKADLYSEDFRKQQSERMKSRVLDSGSRLNKSRERRRRARERMKAQYSDPNSALVLSHQTEAFKQKMREGMLKQRSDKNSKLNKALMSEEHVEKMREKARGRIRSKRYLKKLRHFNGTEKQLDAILQLFFPGEFEYNGDGRLGMKIKKHHPDFVHINGRKKVIEFNGCDWHCCKKCGGKHPFGKEKKEVWRIDKLHDDSATEMGYETLVIWGHEIEEFVYTDDNGLKERIAIFIER